MGKKAAVPVLALCVVVVLMAAAQTAVVAAAAGCNPAALSPCGGALAGGRVTQGCCVQLRAQQGCLCQYARNPAYAAYVNGPIAQSVASACRLPKIKC
ncbi:hypothetical protein ACP70R_043637 [Stipagrostis hirtigluma subsp. patula]